ncbi:MAG: hypothetical protein WDO69_05225 [Pseudomonadota bacterium]
MLGLADGACASHATERDPEMDEVFARASFEATIEEIVEVTLRVGFLSPAVRRARRRAMFFAGAGASIGLLVVARAVWSGYWIALLPVSLLLATLCGYLGGRDYDRSAKKRTRQHLVDRFKGPDARVCEVELRASGLWLRQDGVEYLYQWTDIKAVEDTPISVDFAVKNTILVVRNRAFSETADREGFVGHARRLASTVSSGPSN